MLATKKLVRIISLGEIITPDVMKAVNAFTLAIVKKQQVSNPYEIGKSIGFVLQQNMDLINNFKLGELDETKFTQQMIDALVKNTGIQLSVNEFDDAWNVMNPKFEQFSVLLKQAVDYNRQPDQQIIFISFTNPKDIRHLINELEQNQQSYRVTNNQLIEIGGIELQTTYTARQTKAELIEATIKRLKTTLPSKSVLVNSMAKALCLDKTKDTETADIKYIRCVNNVSDPILKEDLDKINQEVENKTETFLVDTILWMKKEQPLSDVLSSQQIPSRLLPLEPAPTSRTPH